jgi:YD repeat-containing protein
LLITTDNLGLVEARTYWPDGLLKSLADADGRTAYQFHDSLHRLMREDLPGDMARSRSFTYTIHGDVLTETDPRGQVTRHAYDTLGRRISTTFPAVDDVTASVTTDYDDVGNVIEQTNARGQATTFGYNDLNQKMVQTDPIEYTDNGTTATGDTAAAGTSKLFTATAVQQRSTSPLASIQSATRTDNTKRRD